MPKRQSRAAERQRWTEHARQHLQGRTIVQVEYMEDEEARDLDWSELPLVLTLDDGTVLVPMRDDEGNGAGAVSCQKSDGTALGFPVLRRW